MVPSRYAQPRQREHTTTRRTEVSVLDRARACLNDDNDDDDNDDYYDVMC